MEEEPNLDDLMSFDQEEAVDVPLTREEVEHEQTNKIRAFRKWRDVIVSPEVAQCLRDGITEQELAEVLGCSLETVKKYTHSADMATLLAKESRRVLTHISKRDLSTEKYRDLVVSLGVLSDKERQRRNEPEADSDKESATAILDRVATILWGPDGRRRRNPVIDVTPESNGSGVSGLLRGDDEEGSEED